MGAKDIAEKALLSKNDVFADIINNFLYNGRQVIKPEALEDAPTTYMYDDNEKVHELHRDVAKYWKDGNAILALIGVENQTEIDIDMPLRMIAYDGAAYRVQLLNKHRQKRYPVVSVILYSGKRRWNYNKTLLECLDVPDVIKPFVNDYKINVLEVAHMTEEQLKLLTSDYKIIANTYMQNVTRMNDDVLNISIKHPYETFQLLSVITDNPNYLHFGEKNNGGDVTVYDFLKEATRLGEARGEARGEERGRAEGEARGMLQKALTIATNLKRSKTMSDEEIAELTELTLEQVKAISV